VFDLSRKITVPGLALFTFTVYEKFPAQFGGHQRGSGTRNHDGSRRRKVLGAVAARVLRVTVMRLNDSK
jgi:hypothetical protein